MYDSQRTERPRIDDLWFFSSHMAELEQQRCSQKIVNIGICSYRITRLVLCISLILVATCFLAAGSAQAEQVRKVLVLNSYHPTYEWTKSTMRGIEFILQQYEDKVELSVEYMDTKRFNDSGHYKNLYNLYKSKASNEAYEVVIATDNSALLFLLRYRDELYPNVPIVFCGVDRFHGSMLDNRPRKTSVESILNGHGLVSGVMESFDYESTIEIALKFHPKADKVILINSDPNEDMYWPTISTEEIERFSRRFRDRADFTSYFLTKDNIGQLLEKIEALGSDSIVYLTSDFKDIFGKPYEFKYDGVMILERCVAPVYIVWREWFGCGPVVGGNLVSGFYQGRKAAEMVIRILDGESIQNIPILRKSPNQYEFDYFQLNRFGISLSELPEGSIVFNRSKSFYGQYKMQCWAAITVVLFLAAMVILLSANILRRKRAELALEQSEAIYRMAIENARGVPYQLRVSDGKYIFMGSGAEKLFGIPAANLTRPMFHEMIEQVIPVGTSTYDEIKDYGKRHSAERVVRGQADIRIRTPNGEAKWLNDSFLPFRDEQTGEITGTIGILQDITDRKQAEQALRESETRYKVLFETAAEGILVADVESMEFKYANPAICRMLGYTAEELKKMNVRDIHPKESLEHVISEFKAQARAERTLAPNIPCLRKDGKIIYADINTTNVLIDARECNVGIFTDITEHKRAEEALRESEARYRNLVEQLPAMTYTAALDEASTTLYISPQVEQILGVSLAEYRSDPDFWRRRLHPEDQKRVMAELNRTHKTNQPFVLEYRMISKDKRVVWVHDEARIIKGEEGQPLYLQGVMYDITERKRTEQKLREIQGQQKAILDNIPDIAWLKDKESVYIAVNEPFADACGLKPEDLVGKTDLDIWPVDLARKYVAEDKEIMQIGKRKRIEEPLENKEGRRISLETIKTPIYNDKGEVVGTIGIARDITERKRAEQELQQARDELEVRVEQRTADLLRTNIELRKEINERQKVEEKLLTYQKRLRFLASELSLAEERLRRRVAIDVHDHIGQNLAISKIKIESLRELVSSPEHAKTLEEVRDLVAQTIKSMRSLMFELSPPVLYEMGFEAAVEWLVRQAEKQHGFSVKFHNDRRRKPLAHNVRVFLFQAVRELLVNVAKHAHARNVKVSSRRSGDQIRVSVEDDGVGFDVSQVHSYDYQKGGFGLFSIRERLGYINGDINISSKPGKTRITLVAPINHKNGNGKGK